MPGDRYTPVISDIVEALVAPHLLLALIGLLYVLLFGALSFFRRERLSMRFMIEGLLITAIGAGTAALTGSAFYPAFFVAALYIITMRVRLLVDLGNLLARRGNHAGAERVYDLAHRLGPDEAGRLLVQLNQGVLALHREHLDEAVAAFRQVLAASDSGFLGVKSESACLYNLGVAYQRQGLDAQATLEFNKVLDTWPATEYARYARIALDRRRREGGAGKPQA